MIERPDAYILIKINVKENKDNHQVGEFIKLYSTWFGGFASSDSWRLNSGITKIEKKMMVNNHLDKLIEYPIYTIYGNSSTIYEVGNNVGSTSWTLNNIKNLFKDLPDYVEVDIIEDKEEVLKIMDKLVDKTK